jgi:hypothetical protein
VYLFLGSIHGFSEQAHWQSSGDFNGDMFGWSISGAGDVNKDGFDDVLIGAPYNDEGGSNAGKIFLYYGSSQGLNHSSPWTLQGENPGDLFGWPVAAAGDVNGDGYDDVIVGAVLNDAGATDAGKTYVFYGSHHGCGSVANWTATGISPSEFFARSVASAGDVNGDGYDDVIVGADENDEGGTNAGKAFVFYGSEFGLSNTADWTFNGEGDDEWLGNAVASAGDINGDTYDDIVIAAYGSDYAGLDAGKVYVFHGSENGLGSNDEPVWTWSGETDYDYFGFCVASLGDINNDGYEDIAIGSKDNDEGGANAGKVYLCCGSERGLFPFMFWEQCGAADGDSFGFSIAGLRKCTSTASDAIVIGIPKGDGDYQNTGACRIYMLNQSLYTFPLYGAWNLITIPYLSTMTAKDLLQNLTNCTVVYGYNASGNEPMVVTVTSPPETNFPIVEGTGYFVAVNDGHHAALIKGNTITQVSVHLYPGWNMLGWYHGHVTTAKSILQNITGCSVVYWYDAGNAVAQIVTSASPPEIDFPVTQGMGLFVAVTTESDWHGEG